MKFFHYTWGLLRRFNTWFDSNFSWFFTNGNKYDEGQQFSQDDTGKTKSEHNPIDIYLN